MGRWSVNLGVTTQSGCNDESGYAYDVEVANFRTLIAELNLNELNMVTVVETVLKHNTNSDLLIDELAIALSNLSKCSVDRLDYGLKNLHRQFGFKEKWKRKLSY